MTTELHSSQELLGKIDLFAGMSNRNLKKLANVAMPVRHATGSVVTAEGRSGIALHVIVSGTAAVTLNGTHRRSLGPGEYFGEISMIDGKPRSATITAVDELHTLALTHADVEGLLSNEPGFARTLLLLLCSRLREIEAAS